MTDYEFIKENSHWHKIWTLIGLIVIILAILIVSVFFSGVVYSLVTEVSFTAGVLESIKDNIANATLTGIFYANLIGGIFFIPSPDEVIFYYALIRGNSYILTITWALVGYMIAQVINYFLGKKISGIVLNLVSKKKVYSARRMANRYGSWGIVIFNFLPLPAPLLTFALGIANYKFLRLMILTIIGKVAKYGVLIAIHSLT